MELLQFKILNTTIERILNHEMADLGLTYTQATVIGYLKQNMNKEVCQKDIEYNLGLTHPTVSSILNRMEDSGMIVTEAFSSDHRRKKIILTEKAISRSEFTHEKIDKIKEQIFQGIPAEEQENLGNLINKMIQNLS